MSDHLVHEISQLELQSGDILENARLAYKTYGELNQTRDNVVVLPTFYTGSHIRNEGFFGAGRAIDPAKHFIVSVNLFGNGISSSPSNHGGADYPAVTLFDNIVAQHDLLFGALGVERIAMVTGWSMAGCQSFQWAAQFPDLVDAIVPFCASAKTAIHNQVFLKGVKAALQADSSYQGGRYESPPEAGLKAFGRIYAGWAFSQTFYRDEMFKQLGFDNAEALLEDWEQDHLHWDANDLLCKLETWLAGDISANPLYNGDFELALASIKAKTTIISCDNDLYFRPEDNEYEARYIPGAQHHIYQSPWGHCVASPGNCPEFHHYLDAVIAQLLNRPG